MSVRTLRVASEIQRVLAGKLLKTPAFLTILEVDISPDLANAKIYFSLFGSETQCKQTIKLLEQEKKALRREVGKHIKLHSVPELTWIRDNTPERADRIHQLLK